MTSITIGKIVGTGTIGVLVAAIIASSILNISTAWIFGVALLIFVGAGAIALVAKNIR